MSAQNKKKDVYANSQILYCLVKSCYKALRYSCGLQFPSSHHEHECKDSCRLFMISLNCFFFFPEKINYVTLKLNDFKKQELGRRSLNYHLF